MGGSLLPAGLRAALALANHQGGGGGVLIGDGDFDVVAAEFEEAGGDGLVGELGAIAVAAEVAEVELLQVGVQDLVEDIGGGVIGEVAVAAEDALLQTPWTSHIFLQELQVVIGFQDNDVRAADAFHDELGGMAEVREETDGASTGIQDEADGVLGVVRDGKGVDAHLTQFERGAGDEHAAVELGRELAFDGFAGVAIAVNGDVEFGGDGGEALDMIAVFVGDENARQPFGSAADGGQSLADLAAAEAGIDEQTRLTGLQIGTIATGTAA